MDGTLGRIALFPLTIELDEDDIDWTHLLGVGSRLTVQELPDPLRTRARLTIEFLRAHAIMHLAVQVGIFPVCLYKGDRRMLPEGGPEDLLETLRLMSWWMEWSHRRACAHWSWKCPECQGEVKIKRGICDDSLCSSWDILHLITGEPILRLVPKTGTHGS
ncbi:hypothetical protein HY630_02815 [Candidatus Uhrbacteria bacterium]|nr:hypothetical protein [Candidatus Uhrbacteria bacterium]